MHITHWVPTSGALPPWSCIESWLNMDLPDGVTRTFRRSLAGSVKLFWNKAVRDFLDSDSDWLLSTHHDIQFVPETLTRLLSWDKPLISALVFMRHNPVVPQLWKTYDKVDEHYVPRIIDTRKWFYSHKEWIRFGPFVIDPRPEDALIDAGFTSTACTLMHRSVLEKIQEGIGGDLWFECDSELTGGGEDRRFFEYARAVGFPCWVDRSCVAGHVAGDICTSSADFIAWDSVSTFQNTGEPADA